MLARIGRRKLCHLSGFRPVPRVVPSLTARKMRFYATQETNPLRPEEGNPPLAQPPKRFAHIRRHPYVAGFILIPITITASLALVVGGLLAYDSLTYSTKHRETVGESIEFKGKIGGPDNLKIAEMPCEEDRKKLVIVGGGWGSIGVIKGLNKDDYEVTIVSPENYFLFQPLLPSAVVGTVEIRSLVEPLRKLLARLSGHYVQGKAVDVAFKEQLLEISPMDGSENFYLPYDKLIIACGSVNATFGVPGLENSLQLKTVRNALDMRRKIAANLEKAALPIISDEERSKLLSFVVCGGGPTGVEIASEIYDMIDEDVMAYMPNKLHSKVRISIIQSREHILNTYSEAISKYAEDRFKRSNINTIVNARVKKITPDGVIYTLKNADGTTKECFVDAGLTVWSTGIAMNPFTKHVANKLPNQFNRHALEVDSHLRVLGTPLGTVYAVGDAATIETRLVEHLWDYFDTGDADKSGTIDKQEFQTLMKLVNRRFPTAQIHVDKISDFWEKYVNKATGTLGLNEVASMFLDISKRMTALPATAQVADQEGTYLAKKLSHLVRCKRPEDPSINVIDEDDMFYKPFTYNHLGSLAYIGNAAVLDLEHFGTWTGGIYAMYAWRSVYLSQQVSFRNRMLLVVDWIKRGIWGRDLSSF